MEQGHPLYKVEAGQIYFACPHCAHPGFVPVSMAGQQVSCPKCATLIAAPTPGGPEPARRGAVKVLEGREARAAGRFRAAPSPVASPHEVGEWETGLRPPPPDAARSAGTFILKRTPMVLVAVGILVLVAVVIALLPGAFRSGPVAGPARAPDSRAIAARNQALPLVHELLAAPSWEALVPHIRDRDRVLPIMEEYYASQPWVPTRVRSLIGTQRKMIDGLQFFEVTVFLVPGAVADPSATLVFEETDDGPKLDWELFADIPGWEWGRFLEERPTAPRKLRVALKRSSLPDSSFRAFGFEPGDALGFRLWARDPEESVFTIVPSGAPLAERLLADADWNAARRMIVELAWAGEHAGDRFVTIQRIVKDGWIFNHHSPAE
ncbi:hypothetical protein BH23VER1_BH23VER1_28840 [soil metagenome]